jgi:hypothetical protein
VTDVQRLLEHYIQGVRFPEVSGFEVLELLDVRSNLAAREGELSATERAQLESADTAFRRQASSFYESVAELGEMEDLRRHAGAPCSHSLAELYQELAAEDVALAEAGMTDYQAMLAEADGSTPASEQSECDPSPASSRPQRTTPQ